MNFPPSLKIVPANEKGRDFVVGDIHGCYDKLIEALKAVDFHTESDRLFSVGDIVDRGPQNVECLRLIREPWFHAVVGNHEDMMFETVLGISYCRIKMWIPNGGGWYLTLSGPEKAEVDDLIEHAFKTLPLGIIIDRPDGKLGIVHAAWPTANLSEHADNVKADEELFMQSRSFVTWDRGGVGLDEAPNELAALYMGHNPRKEMLTVGKSNWIDTAAAYGGKLTLLEI